MKTKICLAAIFSYCCIVFNPLCAQNANSIWYFGIHAGLDFNTGTPVPLSNGVLNTAAGCASIADAAGALLFYTDGITVWNRNHVQMPDGDSLAGGFQSTQSALIVPKPSSVNLFYIFTVQQYNTTRNFSYSVVDLSLDGGNGDVTNKNTLIISNVTEKLTAVKHANNADVWVMVHGYGTNNFSAYLVSSTGISAPVTSAIGPVVTSSNAVGYMKFSPDGSKIAYAANLANYVDLFDFNSTTGTVSNEKYLTLPTAFSGAYGVEFSLSGIFLYSIFALPGTLFQWDITSNIAATINATRQQVGSSASSGGALQLAPDGKIYVAGYQRTFLGAINSPELAGTLCNFVDNAVFLGGDTALYGLPNFVQSNFLPTAIHSQENDFNFSVYPNPVTSELRIENAELKIEGIEIYNVMGEELNSSVVSSQWSVAQQLSVNNYQVTLDVSRLIPGIYLLKVKTPEKSFAKKIIVSR